MDHSTAQRNGRPERFDADATFDRLGKALTTMDTDQRRLTRRVRFLQLRAVPAAMVAGLLLGLAFGYLIGAMA